MRLICPNCDAQYEVAAGAITDAGRDVQCSSCGHAWFQLRPEVEAAREAEAELFDAPAEIATATTPEVVPDVDAPAVPSPVAGLAQRRAIDDSALSVLREEAEREAAVRRAEAPQGVEMQPDLGAMTPPPMTPVTPAARHIARMKGVDPEKPVQDPAKPAARRDLLPNIEEINSTLRASNDRRGGATMAALDAQGAGQSREGFRSGFVLMMVVAVLLVLAYVAAPKIAVQMPGAADALASYVSAVDGLRIWIDEVMKGAIKLLQGAAKPES